MHSLEILLSNKKIKLVSIHTLSNPLKDLLVYWYERNPLFNSSLIIKQSIEIETIHNLFAFFSHSYSYFLRLIKLTSRPLFKQRSLQTGVIFITPVAAY